MRIQSTFWVSCKNYRFWVFKINFLDQTHPATLVQGTLGCLDPEYFQTSHYTNKSNVYRFGVVLVELLTGQKPVSLLQASEGRSSATYFVISIEESHPFDILDAPVLEQGTVEEIIAVASVAKRCLNMRWLTLIQFCTFRCSDPGYAWGCFVTEKVFLDQQRSWIRYGGPDQPSNT